MPNWQTPSGHTYIEVVVPLLVVDVTVLVDSITSPLKHGENPAGHLGSV